MATLSTNLTWKNSLEKGSWWSIVPGITKSLILFELLSTHTFVSQVQVIIVLLSLLPSNSASLMENPRWH